MKINMKGRTNRQILDSPSPQQGVPELISGLTGLCVYVFPRIIDGAIIYSIYYIFFRIKRGRLFEGGYSIISIKYCSLEFVS